MSGRRVPALIAPIMIIALMASACTDDGGAGSPPSSSPSSSPSRSSSQPSPSSSVAGPGSRTPSPVASTEPAGSAHGSVRGVRTLASGLNVPWGLALLPGGDLLVSSRDDRTITRIDRRSGEQTPVGTVEQAVSNVDAGGEAGLLGIAVSPRFGTDHLLYVYYSTAHDNRIARFDYHPDRPAGDRLTGQQVIVSGIPLGLHHDGGRIAFGPDGLLYAATGEAGEPSLSQDKSSLGGKILRMTPSGDPAPGNPDPESVVYSYGHRNVQGLAWDPAGRLWASEFGDKTADELNLIRADHNYGWPDTQGRTDDRRFTSPVAQWGTDEDSPSGIAYAAGSIWMAALRGERLWRIPLDGTRPVAEPEDFLNGEHGRLRSVLAVDGDTILVTTSNTDGRGTPRDGDDRILELKVS